MKINMVTLMLLALVAAVVVAGCVPVPENTGTINAAQKNDAMMKDNTAMEDNHDNSMEGEVMMEGYKGKVLAGTTTPYLDFNQEDYEKALAEGKTILLYFYANWCPTCKAEQPRAHDAFSQLDDEKLVGFRVNYRDSDTDSFETELAKEFGITYQHTKIIIKDGKRVLKSPENWDADRYVTELTGA